MKPNFASRTQLDSLLARRFPGMTGIRKTPLLETIPTGIAELDTTLGGIGRGALTEIIGPVSSGCTSLLISVLATLTQRQEVCALVDASDMFYPESAAAAGVQLERLLWVRCNSESGHTKPKRQAGKQTTKSQFIGVLEQTFKVADLILQSKGFGLVALDLAAFPVECVRRVPLTSWFRFRRVVENTRTALLVLEREPHAKGCASLVLKLNPIQFTWTAFRELAQPQSELPSHANLLQGLGSEMNIMRFRPSGWPGCESHPGPLRWEIRTGWGYMPSQADGQKSTIEATFASFRSVDLRSCEPCLSELKENKALSG